MSWSCPLHCFQLPLHVPVIFSVCPLHFPCMSRSFVASQFPASRVVPIGCLVLPYSFYLHSPCFHFCPSSPWFPFHFPLLSCHVDFLFPPLISLHFLACPLCSPAFPAKNTGFSSVFAKRTSKNRVFPDFRQKEKEPAGGFEPKTPVWRHRLGARHAEQCRRIPISLNQLQQPRTPKPYAVNSKDPS